jgi:hypothetical protein
LSTFISRFGILGDLICKLPQWTDDEVEVRSLLENGKRPDDYPLSVCFLATSQAITNGDYVHAPLTPLGQQQAAQTGQYLNLSRQPLDGFYTSPLRRAQETATIIGTHMGATPSVENDIRELEALEPGSSHSTPLCFCQAKRPFIISKTYVEANSRQFTW